MALGGGGIKIPPIVSDPKKDKKKKQTEGTSRFAPRSQALLQSKWTLNFIMLVPFIMLLVSAVSCYFPDSNKLFIITSNLFGFSIITNLYFLFYAYKHRFCTYSKISIYTLILLNILNITHIVFDLGTLYHLYDQIIAFTGIVLAGIFAIKERK